jgi:hypothetical protein
MKINQIQILILTGSTGKRAYGLNRYKKIKVGRPPRPPALAGAEAGPTLKQKKPPGYWAACVKNLPPPALSGSGSTVGLVISVKSPSQPGFTGLPVSK